MQQAPQGVHLIYRHVKITWLLCIVHSSNIKKLRISPVFFLYFPKKAWGKIDSSIITLKVESTRKGLARWSSIINRWQIFATYLTSPFFQEIYSSAFQERGSYERQINHQVQYLTSPPHIWSEKMDNLNSTLEYLITVQHLLNVHNGKLDFIWLPKKDNLMLLNWW